MPYLGWYAPGMNIHRSAFCGRNYEYFSEDTVLTGKMSANVAGGAKEKGVYVYLKHFALNEQETDRSGAGLVTWANEQTIREIHLRQFEIAVTSGNVMGVMSSFNRIGTVWAGGDYRLLTEILRNEWGFEGSVITDFTSASYMDPEQMVYAGGNLNLANETKYMWKLDAKSDDFAADVLMLRDAVKGILYVTANSNAYSVEVYRCF